MKKTSLILAAALVCACAKDATPERTARVTFNLGGVTSGTMTKGAAEMLASTAPSGPFTIKLTSTTNAARTYTITAGDTEDIILDTYNAVCKYYPATGTDFFRAKVYASPCFEAKASVTITEGTTSVSLPATYTCFAVILDEETTAKYSLYALGAETDLLTSGIAYIRVTSAWNASGSATLYAYPTDDAHYETTLFPLATEATEGRMLVENGKWYIFSPAAASSASGTIGIDLPEWTEGATE